MFVFTLQALYNRGCKTDAQWQKVLKQVIEMRKLHLFKDLSLLYLILDDLGEVSLCTMTCFANFIFL